MCASRPSPHVPSGPGCPHTSLRQARVKASPRFREGEVTVGSLMARLCPCGKGGGLQPARTGPQGLSCKREGQRGLNGKQTSVTLIFQTPGQVGFMLRCVLTGLSQETITRLPRQPGTRDAGGFSAPLGTLACRSSGACG